MKQSDSRKNKYYSKEDIENLSRKMDEDIDEMLRTSDQMKSYRFSRRYEAHLERSLKKRLGREKAAQLLEKRRRMWESEGADQRRPKHPFSLKSSEKLSGQSLREKITHLSIPGLAQLAVAAILIIMLISIIGKNEANASWWDNIKFIISSYKDYSKIEAYDEVESEDITYPEIIEKKYLPTKAAEGYEEVAREEMSKQITVIYENKQEIQYVYTQQIQNVSVYIDTENEEYNQCDTLFGEAYYLEKENYCKLVWSYEKYLFVIEGNLSKKQVIDIANSLRAER